MTNESVKENLKDYLLKHGVRNNFIAEKIGISNTSICLFLQGKRLLSEDKLNQIEELINKSY
ncbi:helix-turn-helix transcriptional regulator [Clostridium sp. P21]|uniref:Helix-turn-helix transcriptional regulator n=1 Tax=Clostridium muellerianum TaxID=2716538 RepID=A0A7Y0ED49_9CLOT|nr:helix-turn-helix transcriptional regulator [Clostridium muellerianum]NMM61176.1 helix-turn-helix transcriptional regulator [Clostridium muellerianum]